MMFLHPPPIANYTVQVSIQTIFSIWLFLPIISRLVTQVTLNIIFKAGYETTWSQIRISAQSMLDAFILDGNKNAFDSREVKSVQNQQTIIKRRQK